MAFTWDQDLPPITGIPFLPSLLTFPLIQEVRWYLGTCKQGEKSLPIIELAREDDITGIRITPNEHFLCCVSRMVGQ
ncbi:MAG: hypothetical protein EOM92_05605 [Gammaproteobacteria bacterium]|jgi:hypothetical protein|nr:hypothetical protein [Gammaproteobacteria bacterium]